MVASASLLYGLAAAVGLVQLASAGNVLVPKNNNNHGCKPKPDCNQNNCLRAIIGSAFPTRDGLADCNSYLLSTIKLPTR